MTNRRSKQDMDFQEWCAYLTKLASTMFGIPPEQLGRAEGKIVTKVMKLQQPTAGRIVHVFPGTAQDNLDTPFITANGAPMIPAMVTQVFPYSWTNTSYTGINVVATNDNGVLRPFKSLQHKSTVTEGLPYWEWPMVK